MTTDREKLAEVAAMEREGIDFYSQAAKVASDPRAKEVFLRLARDKAETMRMLGNQVGLKKQPSAAEPTGRVPPRTKKVQTTQPVYPRAAIEPLVCFVCGEEIRGIDIPSECPSCGASGYAFEVDIDQATALAMAIESQTRNIDVLRRTTRSVSDARTKQVLQRLADLERTSLRELKAELRKTRS